jgi:hypothetical protein
MRPIPSINARTLSERTGVSRGSARHIFCDRYGATSFMPLRQQLNSDNGLDLYSGRSRFEYRPDIDCLYSVFFLGFLSPSKICWDRITITQRQLPSKFLPVH